MSGDGQDLEELREQTEQGSRLDDSAPTSFKDDVEAALSELEGGNEQPMLSIYDANLRAFVEAIEADESREAAFREAAAEAAGREDDSGRRSPLLANVLRVGLREVDGGKWDAAVEVAAEQAEF